MAPRRPENAVPAARVQTVDAPPGTRKTKLERSMSRIGALVSEDLKHDSDHSIRRERRLLSADPNGHSVLDRLGYRTSRAKVLKSSRPRRRRHPVVDVMREAEERERIEELMGAQAEKRGRAVSVVCMCMREYKWGFGMDPRLWGEKPSQEEWERLTALVAGSPFRE
ncbi:hypothetical protein VUR80DRAFT_4671 [Thermomyces stellatus]